MQGKKIIICVTGSVASCEVVKIARELRRQGAEVHCVMSKAARKLIQPDLLYWASDNRVITKLTGECEHVKLCGQVPNKADLVLVCPSTANTISKIAQGVDDTIVTTIVSTAIGSKIPIIIVPAMHISLYEHPIVKENIRKLIKIGVDFIFPKIEENKAKLADYRKITDIVELKFTPKNLKGKKILVTTGATIEDIDDVRFITNRSSGKMGIALADEAFKRGAEITLIKANVLVEPKYYHKTIDVRNVKEMWKAIKENINNDIMLHCAAVSDFSVKKVKGKIKSGKKLNLELRPTKKLINEVRKLNKKIKVVGFKAEIGKSVEELKKVKLNADMTIANSDAFGNDDNEVVVIDDKGVKVIGKDKKNVIANKILDEIK